MRIFLSYASEDRSVAERIYLALIAEGHQVFFDRTGTEAGAEFNRRIRDSVYRCHRFVFLISPHSIEQGSYTLTELSFAQERWPHPADKVLPVTVSHIDLNLVPNYLKAVTILEPQGDVAAEVASRLRPKKGLRSLLGRRALLAVTTLGVLGLVLAALIPRFFAEKPPVVQEKPVVQIKSEEIIPITKPGFGYRYAGQEGLRLSEPDYLDHGNVSRLVLLEDGKQLGPGHSGHRDIEDLGKGRYSHWSDDTGFEYLYFSTSDNSDPRTNDRVYSVTVADSTVQSITIPAKQIVKVKQGESKSFGYRYRGSGLRLSTPDSKEQPNISRLVVLEDGKRLGPAHSSYTEIVDIGRGRYSHWHDRQAEWLFFSTSDNSNPIHNGRVYGVTVDEE